MLLGGVFLHICNMKPLLCLFTSFLCSARRYIPAPAKGSVREGIVPVQLPLFWGKQAVAPTKAAAKRKHLKKKKMALISAYALAAASHSSPSWVNPDYSRGALGGRAPSPQFLELPWKSGRRVATFHSSHSFGQRLRALSGPWGHCSTSLTRPARSAFQCSLPPLNLS